LTIQGDAEETVKVGDFAPKSERVVTLMRAAPRFRWGMDYTTHGGLSMTSCGAWPASAESEDFLSRLKDRDTHPFLRELFDADVLTADGRSDATTLRNMEREDGIVPVVFRKANGVVYVTALARKKPPAGAYWEGISVDAAFKGRAEAVDEMTGEPTGARVEVEPLPNGLRLRNLRVPYIPAHYGARLQTPVSVPVIRIAP